MTKTPAGGPRGRHARPPSQALSQAAARLRRAALRAVGEGRRRAVTAGAGTVSAALVAVAAVLTLAGGVLPGGGSGGVPGAAIAAQTGAGRAPTPSASAGDPDDVPDALPYLTSKDPGGKVVAHVKQVRRSGEFLRVYTDLGEDDENSKAAVSLCEWATQFLKDGGDDKPRVFVHGKSSDNGSVVLANKQSDKDDCEVAETP